MWDPAWNTHSRGFQEVPDIQPSPNNDTMDPLTRYMIFFLACMAAIVLLTYLPDRAGSKAKDTDIPSENVEQGLDTLHQLED